MYNIAAAARLFVTIYQTAGGEAAEAKRDGGRRRNAEPRRGRLDSPGKYVERRGSSYGRRTPV